MLKRRRLLTVAAVAITIIGAVAWMSSGGAERKTAAPAAAQTAADAPAMTLALWLEKIDAASVEDLRGLADAALAVADPELRHAILTRLTQRWLEADARGFVGFLTALEIRGSPTELAVLTDALRDSLTLLSPEVAASDDVRLVVQRLISILVATDPEGALAWARLWLVEDSLETAMVSITRNLARTDVGASLALAAEIRSSLRRGQAYAALAGVWAEADFGAAFAWASNLPDHSERAMSLNSVLLAMARSDPDLAADALRAQVASINETYALERARELAAKGISEADLAADPAAYHEMVAAGAIPSPLSPDAELLAIAGKVIGIHLAAEDPLAAIAWAESLQGDYLKLTAISGVLEGWARKDPAGAVRYLLDHHPANNDLVSSLYRAWAATDPAAAAEGTRLLADQGRREVALANVVTLWGATGDAAAAVAYVNSMPASAKTDAIYYALASAISTKSPLDAWQAATRITDQSAQYRALKSAFAVMVTHNPTQAAKLLKSTELPAVVSARLGELLAAVGQG